MTAAPTSSSPPQETAPARGAGLGRAAIALWAGAALCLVAAGLVLWDARGAGVFTDVLAAAIAWCF